MTERTIKYLPLADIQPEPRNPRVHESIEDVKASIRRFGFVEPIVKDERTGKLIAGHGRVEALQWMLDQKQDPPSGVTVKAKRWLVPVVHGWSSTDDDEAAGLLIALNRTVETGGWDDERLAALLGQLAASTAGLEGVGFSDEYLQQLIDDLETVVDLSYEPESVSDGLRSLTLVMPGDQLDEARDALIGRAPEDVTGHSAYRMGLALLQVLGISSDVDA